MDGGTKTNGVGQLRRGVAHDAGKSRLFKVVGHCGQAQDLPSEDPTMTEMGTAE